jgi:hypothetical protein
MKRAVIVICDSLRLQGALDCKVSWVMRYLEHVPGAVDQKAHSVVAEDPVGAAPRRCCSRGYRGEPLSGFQNTVPSPVRTADQVADKQMADTDPFGYLNFPLQPPALRWQSSIFRVFPVGCSITEIDGNGVAAAQKDPDVLAGSGSRCAFRPLRG